MPAIEDTYFAIRFTGANGVEQIYTAKALSAYPTGAGVPTDAAPEVRATVAALEALLGSAAVATVSAEDIGPEGQMIG